MAGLAFSLSIFIAAPSAGAPGVVVAPIEVIGLAPEESTRLHRNLIDSLRAAGARIVDPRLSVACAAEPECVLRRAKKLGARAVISLSVVRVGSTVQATLKAVAVDGETLVDETQRVKTGRAPSFDRWIRALVGLLTPLAPVPRETPPEPLERRDTPEPLAPPVPLEPPEPPEPSESSEASPAATTSPAALGPWLGLGTSAVCLTGGVAFLLAARADIHRVEDARPGTSWRDVEAAYDRAPVLSGVGWTLAGVGVAGGIASLLWLAFGEEVHLTVIPNPSIGGFGAAGRF